MLDPACGSGHILVYAFDLLYSMYEEEGYLPEEIPAMILAKNLFGFEIDQRAAEIAKFALEMKARAKDAKFFERCIDANITVLDPIRFSDGELEEAGMLAEHTELLEAFAHLDEIGSLYVPDLSNDIFIDNAIKNLQNQPGMFSEAICNALAQMKATNKKLLHQYSVVIANPPYMTSSYYTSALAKWMRSNYPNEYGDLCAAFITRDLAFLQKGGFSAYAATNSWMFISSFERLRKEIIRSSTICSLVQLSVHGFRGVAAQVCTFVLSNTVRNGFKGCYIRLDAFDHHSLQASKTLEAVNNPDCEWFYRADAEEFGKIPGSPIAYWASENAIRNYAGGDIREIINPRVGLITGDRDRFLRYFWEVALSSTNYNALSNEDAFGSQKRWFPYQKGGSFRKWYGNNSYLVNWEDNGWEMLNDNYSGTRCKAHNFNGEYAFKSALTWTKISSSDFAMRYVPSGFMFDDAGPICSTTAPNQYAALGYLNSSVASYYMGFSGGSTLNYLPGTLLSLPWIEPDHESEIHSLVDHLISDSKQDWDAFETSWDFTQHPLLPETDQHAILIKDNYSRWANECQERFDALRVNEEELNRIFAKIYNMEGEVPIEIPDEKVGVRLADKERDIKSLISYGIGCIFGRYSTDKPGLILADQGSTVSDFTAKVPNAAFPIDEDGILPILDGEWFEDDIVVEFKNWLKAIYGSETLQVNIAFIEDSLGEDLRTYFVKHFYDDHVKTYQKRPIYWLFSSPKKSFNVLVYLHRYDEGTVGDILTGYLRDYISKLNASISSLETSDRAADQKQADKYRNVVKELEEWERDVIYPMAHERIAIDLDDGVKVNYNKFPHALRKVTGLSEWK